MTDKQMERWTDKLTDGQTDSDQIEKYICTDRQMDRQIQIRLKKYICTDRQMDRQMQSDRLDWRNIILKYWK